MVHSISCLSTLQFQAQMDNRVPHSILARNAVSASLELAADENFNYSIQDSKSCCVHSPVIAAEHFPSSCGQHVQLSVMGLMMQVMVDSLSNQLVVSGLRHQLQCKHQFEMAWQHSVPTDNQ